MSDSNLYLRGRIWWLRYNVGGRKVYTSLKTKSVREARRLKNEILGVRAAGDIIREKFGIAAAPTAGAPVPTFAEVAEQYLDHLEARGHLRDQTLAMWRGQVNNWLVPHFGARRIGDITRADVERFVGELRRAQAKKGDKKIGRAHVVNIFRALGRVFRYALREQLFGGANPCDLADKPKGTGPRMVWLTEDETDRLVLELDAQLRDMVTVALYTALRWGEVAGLAWDDVDLEAEQPTLTVRRSYQGPPKNEASAATIDLHVELAALMRLWQAQSTSEWIFPCATGAARKRMSGADRKVLLAAAARAGIKKHVTPHVFRHSVGTWLYANTKDPKAVQRFMRHAALKTTMEIYVKDERPIHEQVNTLQPIRTRKGLRAV